MLSDHTDHGKPIEVLHYRYAFGKYEAKPSTKHQEAIEKFINKRFNSARPEKLFSTHGFTVSSMRYGQKGRLLFTYKECEGKRYCIILEDLPDHEYESASTRDSKRLADCLQNFKTSLETGKFLPIFMDEEEGKEKEKEEVEETDFFYHDGKFIEFTPEEEIITSTDFPQCNDGAPGAGKTLTAIALLEKAYNQGRNVLYVTLREELASKEREIRDDKHVLSDADDAPDYAVQDYVSLLKLIDPTLETKTIVGEDDFNKWLNGYLRARKHQAPPSGISSRLHLIYKEFRNLSGYRESAYLDKLGKKEESVYLELGKNECLFLDVEEKKYLLQLYKEYQKYVNQNPIFDPSFYEIKDFSLFENYVIAVDEVDNFSTLQIRQLKQLTKDIVTSGDSHQLIDDLLPKGPFIRRLFGDNCKYKTLNASKRCGKTIIEFNNKLINLIYDVLGGLTEKGEHVQIEVPEGQHEGSVEWLNDSDASLQALREKYEADELAIITHPEFLEEARKKFPNNRVRIFEQSQGQGFTHVAVYRPFDSKIFAEADKKLIGKESKQKHNLPKEHERENINLAPSLKKVFVGCSRAIESLTIIQSDDNHAVQNIIKRLRPVIVPSTAQPVPKEEKIVAEKKENPNRILEEAMELLRDGDVKQALEERDRLQESHRKIFDEYKIELEVRRRQQAEKDKERLERRRAQKEKMKEKVEEKPSPSLVSSKTTSSAAVFKKPLPLVIPPKNVKRAGELAHSTVPKTPGLETGAGAKIGDIIKRAGSASVLFRRDEHDSCLFVNGIQHQATFRHDLMQFSLQNPDLFSDVPVSDLFQAFDVPKANSKNIQIIMMLLVDPDLQILLKFMMAKLNEDDIRFLIKKLFEEINPDDNGNKGATFVFAEIVQHYHQLLSVLITDYPVIARLLTVEDLTRVINIRAADQTLLSVSAIEVLGGSAIGCDFLGVMARHNPLLLAGIMPEAMFRFHNELFHSHDTDTVSTIVTSAFTTMLLNINPNISLLTDWLAADTWIDYVINVYKTKSSDDLRDFSSKIISPLLHHWQTQEKTPFLRLLEREPNFLTWVPVRFLISKNEELSHSPLILQLTSNPCYHPYIERLDATAPGLFTSEIFFQAYTIPCGEGTRRTCAYRELEETVDGRKIIERFRACNTWFTPEWVERKLAVNDLDFLSREERDKIDRVRQDPSAENMVALLRDTQSERLLFKTTGLFESACFFQEIMTSDRLIDALHAAWQLYPAFIDILSLNSLLEDKAQGSSFPLIDVLIRNKNMHWLLDELIKYDSWFSSFINRNYLTQLSDGPLFSVLSRYCPTMVIKLAKRAEQLPDMPPGKLIFGNPTLIPSHFYWLAKDPAAHELLLSIFESDPSLLDRIPAPAFGMTLKAWPDLEEISSIVTLVQTEAGRRIISLYIADPKRAKKLATPGMLCKQVNDKDVMSDLSVSSPDMAVQLLGINPGLADSLTIQAVIRLKPYFQTNSQMLARFELRDKQLGREASAAYSLAAPGQSKDILTDDESAIVDAVKNNLTVDSLSELMKHPDAWRLLTCTSGKGDGVSFLLGMLFVDTAVLCAACARNPELVKVFPRDFLTSLIYHKQGVEGRCIDLFFAKPAARKFIKMLEPHDEYFSGIKFQLLFDSANMSAGQPYFELALRDKEMHWLLLRMLKSEIDARVFTVTYYQHKLSEGAAFSVACKYCPEFALALAERVLKHTKTATLFFATTETVPSNFYWLSRYKPAHEKLYGIFCSCPHLFKQISVASLCRALPAPFPPNEESSPLAALVQTPHGVGILRLYILKLIAGRCGGEKLKTLANPAYLCKPIKSDNPLYDGKDVLGILLAAVDIDAQLDTSLLVIKLVECNPALIDHASLLILAVLRDAPNMKVEIVNLINKRLRAVANRAVSAPSMAPPM